MSERKGASYEEMELRRGPWTIEEDTLLTHYIASHGDGRWNLLARCSGLKRTGKSCRLRWLNYLKPDIKRGNLSPEEQLLILELHSKWGNRWSRIAQHLPGRTDNEIKNYWRTRVQKQARQLKIDANSSLFRDALRCYWMPRLLERMGSCPTMPSLNANTDATAPTTAIAIPDQAVHHQLPRQTFSFTANSSLPYYSQSAPPENRSSPNTSSCSISLPHPHPDMRELPPGSVDELDRAAFNSLSDGDCSMINNDYELESGDLPPLSASSPSFFPLDLIVSNTDCSKDVGDSSLWIMDESYDMLKNFLNYS